MIFAFAIWNVDNLFCSHIRKIRINYMPSFLGPILQFHAWWHVLSMISGTHSIVAIVMAWCKTHPEGLKNAEIAWKLKTHCNGIIPWIHFERRRTISKDKSHWQ